MEAGQSFVFQWKAEGGPVYVDMHGEPPNAPEGVYTSFGSASRDGAGGNFEARSRGCMAGTGKTGEAPVTIRLTTSGFYETLYMPDSVPSLQRQTPRAGQSPLPGSSLP